MQILKSTIKLNIRNVCFLYHSFVEEIVINIFLFDSFIYVRLTPLKAFIKYKTRSKGIPGCLGRK